MIHSNFLNKTHRFLFNSKISKNIFSLSVPIMIQSILFTLMHFTDGIMVGQLGENVIAAFGNSMQLMMLIFILFAAISQGGSILMVQYFGGKDYDKLKSTSITIIIIGFLVGIILILIFYFMGQKLLYILTLSFISNNKQNPEVVVIGSIYIKIICFSMIFSVPGRMAGDVLRSMGNTKTPVKISIFFNILNVIGNYILIFGAVLFPSSIFPKINMIIFNNFGKNIPGITIPVMNALGYRGAAISTLIFSSFMGITVIFYLFYKNKYIKYSLSDICLFSKTEFIKIIEIGYPMSIDGLFWQGARVFFTLIFNYIGTSAFAVYTIIKYIKGLAVMIISGLAQGITIATGHALGKNKKNLSRLNAYCGIVWCLIITSIPATLLFIFAQQLVTIYKISPETASVALMCVRILSFSIFFTSTTIVITGILRAGGDTKSILFITLVSFLFVGGPLTLLFGILLGFGTLGAFIGISIEEIVKSIVFYFRYKKGKWLKKL